MLYLWYSCCVWRTRTKTSSVMCVSQQILINTTAEHELQNPQSSSVCKLYSVYLKHLLVLINTDSPSTELYLFSIVFSKKTITLNWRELFQWRENAASTELTQLLECQYWHIVLSSMNQFWFFSFFSCKTGMWTIFSHSIRMRYRY